MINKKTKPLLINFNSRKLFEADTQEDMALLKILKNRRDV